MQQHRGGVTSVAAPQGGGKDTTNAQQQQQGRPTSSKSNAVANLKRNAADKRVQAAAVVMGGRAKDGEARVGTVAADKRSGEAVPVGCLQSVDKLPSWATGSVSPSRPQQSPVVEGRSPSGHAAVSPSRRVWRQAAGEQQAAASPAKASPSRSVWGEQSRGGVSPAKTSPSRSVWGQGGERPATSPATVSPVSGKRRMWTDDVEGGGMTVLSKENDCQGTPDQAPMSVAASTLGRKVSDAGASTAEKKVAKDLFRSNYDNLDQSSTTATPVQARPHTSKGDERQPNLTAGLRTEKDTSTPNQQSRGKQQQMSPSKTETHPRQAPTPERELKVGRVVAVKGGATSAYRLQRTPVRAAAAAIQAKAGGEEMEGSTTPAPTTQDSACKSPHSRAGKMAGELDKMRERLSSLQKSFANQQAHQTPWRQIEREQRRAQSPSPCARRCQNAEKTADTAPPPQQAQGHASSGTAACVRSAPPNTPIAHPPDTAAPPPQNSPPKITSTLAWLGFGSKTSKAASPPKPQPQHAPAATDAEQPRPFEFQPHSPMVNKTEVSFGAGLSPKKGSPAPSITKGSPLKRAAASPSAPTSPAQPIKNTAPHTPTAQSTGAAPDDTAAACASDVFVQLRESATNSPPSSQKSKQGTLFGRLMQAFTFSPSPPCKDAEEVSSKEVTAARPITPQKPSGAAALQSAAAKIAEAASTPTAVPAARTAKPVGALAASKPAATPLSPPSRSPSHTQATQSKYTLPSSVSPTLPAPPSAVASAKPASHHTAISRTQTLLAAKAVHAAQVKGTEKHEQKGKSTPAAAVRSERQSSFNFTVAASAASHSGRTPDQGQASKAAHVSGIPNDTAWLPLRPDQAARQSSEISRGVAASKEEGGVKHTAAVGAGEEVCNKPNSATAHADQLPPPQIQQQQVPQQLQGQQQKDEKAQTTDPVCHQTGLRTTTSITRASLTPLKSMPHSPNKRSPLSPFNQLPHSPLSPMHPHSPMSPQRYAAARLLDAPDNLDAALLFLQKAVRSVEQHVGTAGLQPHQHQALACATQQLQALLAGTAASVEQSDVSVQRDVDAVRDTDGQAKGANHNLDASSKLQCVTQDQQRGEGLRNAQ